MWRPRHRRSRRPHPAAHTLVASTLVAGAALLAGALGGTARAQDGQRPDGAGAPTEASNEVAFATPRVSGSGDWGGVGLPQPLSPSLAGRIRRIFLLQEMGETERAAALTADLGDTTLLGDILADRYLRQTQAAAPDAPNPASPPAALTPALAAWLRAYPDLPDVRAVHAALLARLPRGAVAPPAPNLPFLDADQAGGVTQTPEEADAAELSYTRNPALDRSVRDRAGTGPKGADAALRLIARTRGLSAAYAAQLRAEVALDLFTQGFDASAMAIGLDAWRGDGGQTGLGAFVAGLAAWRSGDMRAAWPHFEAAARARSISSSLRAGAALWAARAHLRAGDPAGYAPWLERAAALPRTFYGLLATRMLGRPIAADVQDGAPDDAQDDAQDDAGDASAAAAAAPSLTAGALMPQVIETLVHPSRLAALSELIAAPLGRKMAAPIATAPADPVLTEIDVEAVGATAAGRRAFALLQVGQDARAEAALRALWAQAGTGIGRDPALRRSIMLVARAAGLTSLSAQTATLIEAEDGQVADGERFPIPRLRPAHGFRTDPALVYALTRLESNFDPRAVSGAGAHGLMQLMPVTAGYVTGDPDRFTAAPDRLHDASLNLDLGQRYVDYLAHADTVGGNLIKLLASYNAGPNAMRSWAASAADEQDPLLFIESIPVDETRHFVRRGLTYLWIYAARMNIPSPSLQALARGDWPRYDREDELAHRPAQVATLH